MIRIEQIAKPIVREALSTRALIAGAVLTYGFAEDKRWAKIFGGVALAAVALEAWQHCCSPAAKRLPPLDVNGRVAGAASVQISAAASADGVDPFAGGSALPDDAPPVTQSGAMS